MILILLSLFLFLNLQSAEKYGTKTVTFNIKGYGKVLFEKSLHPRAWDLESIFLSKPVLDKFKTMIPEGSVVIDIGAHIGDSSVAYSLITGKNGKVIAFEPSETVFEVLKKNAKLHPNIIPANLAVTKNDGIYSFYAANGIWNGVITSDGKLKVKGVNLENWLKKSYPSLINRVKYIKIDTEGYDRHILASIKNLVLRNKPVLQMEVLEHLKKEEKAEFYNLIKSLNYNCYKDDYKGFLDKKQLIKHEGLTLNQFINLKQTDVFCFPK